MTVSLKKIKDSLFKENIFMKYLDNGWINKQKYEKKINSIEKLDNTFQSAKNFILRALSIFSLFNANKSIIFISLKFIIIHLYNKVNVCQ